METIEQERETPLVTPSSTDGIKLKRLKGNIYTWEIIINGHNVEKLKSIDQELKNEWGANDDRTNE